MSSELPISIDFIFGKKYWLALIHGNQNPLLESRFCILGISSRSGSRAAGNSPNALCCVPRSACCTRAVPALLLHSSAGAGTAVQLSSAFRGSVRRRAVLPSHISGAPQLATSELSHCGVTAHCPKATSSLVLGPSRDGASADLLGNLIYGLTTLLLKNFFVIPNLKLASSTFKAFTSASSALGHTNTGSSALLTPLALHTLPHLHSPPFKTL